MLATFLQFIVVDLLNLCTEIFHWSPVVSALVGRVVHSSIGAMQAMSGYKALYFNPDGTPAAVSWEAKK
jgi:hypothetical protein